MNAINKNIGVIRNFSKATTIGQIESTLRVAERLEVFSTVLVDAHKKGEPPEIVDRLICGLHQQLVELSREIKVILPTGK